MSSSSIWIPSGKRRFHCKARTGFAAAAVHWIRKEPLLFWLVTEGNTCKDCARIPADAKVSTPQTKITLETISEGRPRPRVDTIAPLSSNLLEILYFGFCHDKRGFSSLHYISYAAPPAVARLFRPLRNTRSSLEVGTTPVQAFRAG